MPSIMDLVREYSELEIKRNQRGGILEPQLEIRYQALKFFLEFELFPSPTIKSVEQPRQYEKKVAPQSTEIKKSSDTRIEEKQSNIKIETLTSQNSEPINTIDTKAQELATIISETTLPTNETSESLVSSESSTLSEEKVETIDTVTENIPLADTASSEKIATPFDKAEVLDMAEAIDAAVENIVIPDTPQIEMSTPKEQISLEQTISSNYTSPEKAPNETIPYVDLPNQTNEVVKNMTQIEETTRETDQVILENILPEFPNLVSETPSKTTDQTTTNLPVEDSLSPPPSQDTHTLSINIEEVINASLPQEELKQQEASSQPIINIDEIVNNITSSEPLSQKPDSATSNHQNIDLLSGIDLQTQPFTKPDESKIFNTNPSPIPIEEILPSDFIIPEAPHSQVSSDKTFIDTPIKAAIHLIDGDARRGIIKELKESHKKVELFEDESLKNSTTIDISEIKAIFVLRQTNEKISEIKGKRLNIRFKDERSIRGISPDYSESSSVFTLFPIEGIQSAKMIIIYRGFIDQVEEI